jgi:hypothetical protein
LNDHRNFVARPPRHVASAEGTRVEVRRCDATEQPGYAAMLVDFSRQGARLRLADAFQIGDRLLIQIEARPDFVYRQEATVCWRSCESPPHVTYGCGFESPVKWEVLGELLLRGILLTD